MQIVRPHSGVPTTHRPAAQRHQRHCRPPSSRAAGAIYMDTATLLLPCVRPPRPDALARCSQSVRRSASYSCAAARRDRSCRLATSRSPFRHPRLRIRYTPLLGERQLRSPNRTGAYCLASPEYPIVPLGALLSLLRAPHFEPPSGVRQAINAGARSYVATHLGHQSQNGAVGATDQGRSPMTVELSLDISGTGIPWIDDPRSAGSLRQWAAALKEYLSLEWPSAYVDVHMDEKTRRLALRVDGCDDEDEKEIISKVTDVLFMSNGCDAPSDDDDFDPLRWALEVRADPNWLHRLALTTTDQRVRETAVNVLTQWLATGHGLGNQIVEVVRLLTSDGVLRREHLAKLLGSDDRFVREAAMLALPLLDTRREEGDARPTATESSFLRCDLGG